jgi:hypothetical protein
MVSENNNKTRKLKCIITGKTLIATRAYYDRKVAKHGDEDEMHRTYVCKEAKNLLLKGYQVNKIREMLSIPTTSVGDVPEDVVQNIMNSNKPRFKSINNHNIPIASIINPMTDPEVKQFLQYIIDSERE